MNKFQQLSMVVIGLLIVGAGCNVGSLENFGQREEASMVLPYKEKAQNFCSNQKQEAEQRIKEFKLSGNDRKIYEVWKRSFIEFNKIKETFFNEHIFPIRIRQVGLNVGVKEIGYYYKLGDLYLDSGSIDELRIDSGSIDLFNKESVDTLLKTRTSQVDKPPFEDRPEYAVPNKGLYKFQWGTVVFNNISAQPSNILSCEDAVAVLKNCHPDMSAVNVTYKGLLGQAWLDGKAGEWGAVDRNNCASAAFNLFSEKFDSCYLNVNCSGIIN